MESRIVFHRSQGSFYFRHVAFLSAFIGLASYICALGWERFGQVSPCFFCRVERVFFVASGLVSFLAFLIGSRRRFLGAQRLLGVASCLWACASLVIFRHLGVQWKWFALPSVCQATLRAKSSALFNVPFVRCDQIEFLIFGYPPTFYMLGMTLCLFFLCLWGFLCQAKRY